MKHRQLQDEKDYHQSAIDEQLALTEDSRLDELMASLKELDNLFDWGLMTATPEQKKEIISKVLYEFILYQDRIELRYRLPITSEQLAELLKVSKRLPENWPSHRFGVSRGVKPLWNGGSRGCPP